MGAVVFYEALCFGVLLFGGDELFATGHVLVFDDVDFLYDLAQECQIVPVPGYCFLTDLKRVFEHFLHLGSLLFLQLKTNFPAPLNFIRLHFPVVEVTVLNIVRTVPAADRRRV